jgi:hypothetical protein
MPSRHLRFKKTLFAYITSGSGREIFLGLSTTLSDEVYEYLVRASGYASLDDAELRLKVQR